MHCDYQHFKFFFIIQALPDIGKKVSKLEQEAVMLDASGEVIISIKS